MFYSTEQDLHRLKYKEPRNKNLTKEEYKAITSLKNNENTIIKPTDKGSALVILDKQSYINEGQRQLHNTQFYEQTDSDHTDEVINRVNLMYTICSKVVKYPKAPAITSQLILLGLNNFTYYLKSVRIH